MSSKAKPSAGLSVKLVPLSENDDIEAYLVTFEKIMAAHKVEKSRWSQYLAPQLSGRAQLAFAALTASSAGDYDAIKTAMLARYYINEESYRRRFRSMTRKAGETNREVAVRLMDVQQKWMKEWSTEQSLWVMEKKPETCVAAGELADEYEQARRGPRIDTGSVLNPGWRKPVQFSKTVKCGFCGLKGQTEEECRKKVGTQKESSGNEGKIRCYHCKNTGTYRADVRKGKRYSVLKTGTLPVEAAVVDNLPVDVLLGTDVPELTRLISDRKPKAGSSLPKQEDVMVVLTRARARQQLEEEIVRRAKQVQSQVRSKPLAMAGETDEADRQVSAERTEGPKNSLREKTTGRVGEKAYVNPVPQMSLSAKELKELQENDPTLSKVRRKVDQTNNPEGEFFKREGLFYRRWKPPGRGVEYDVEQLILPKPCRKTVLELAHDIPMAGHQGRDKTRRSGSYGDSTGRRYFRTSRTSAKVVVYMSEGFQTESEGSSFNFPTCKIGAV
ncbi:hypothetical protein EMCRGX_G002514 [Ephydatia muelleri]